MSIDVMVSVWKHSKQKAAARLLLIAIADSANDHGEAWPGIKSLAKKCNTGDRNVQKLIKQIEADGELRVVEGGGRSTVNGSTNKYIVITPDIPLPASINEARPVPPRTPVYHLAPVSKRAKGGATQGTTPVPPRAPKPNVNPRNQDGGVRAHVQEQPTPQPTPPPPGLVESDEALRIHLGPTTRQFQDIHTARDPLDDQEIADLPGWIKSLERAGKRSPCGVAITALANGGKVPHPAVAPSKTDAGRAAIEAERLEGLKRWERENGTQGYQASTR